MAVPEQRSGARAGPKAGHHWAHSEGHRAERDQAARPSQPPFFLLALGPAPGTSGRGRSSRYQPAGPSGTLPPLPQPEKRTKSGARQVHTSPRGRAAGGVGELRRARLKGPRSSPALRMLGRGAGRDRGQRARTPRLGLALWRASSSGGAALVLVSAAAGLGPLAGPMQEPRAHSRGGRQRGWAGQARAAARCWLSHPRFRASGAKCCPSKWNRGYARESARAVAGWRMPLCLVRSRAGGHPAPGATLPVRVRTSSPFQSEGSDHPFGQTVDPSRSCTFVSGVVYLGTLTGLSKYPSLRAGPLPSALDACSFLGQAQEETWGQWLSSADR